MDERPFLCAIIIGGDKIQLCLGKKRLETKDIECQKLLYF